MRMDGEPGARARRGEERGDASGRRHGRAARVATWRGRGRATWSASRVPPWIRMRRWGRAGPGRRVALRDEAEVEAEAGDRDGDGVVIHILAALAIALALAFRITQILKSQREMNKCSLLNKEAQIETGEKALAIPLSVLGRSPRLTSQARTRRERRSPEWRHGGEPDGGGAWRRSEAGSSSRRAPGQVLYKS
uniref:Uncharacterized protein n=1 Tax=Oryza punctata TaxID=4537 RepID=A0A0E0L8B8_ORYPU